MKYSFGGTLSHVVFSGALERSCSDVTDCFMPSFICWIYGHKLHRLLVSSSWPKTHWLYKNADTIMLMRCFQTRQKQAAGNRGATSRPSQCCIQLNHMTTWHPGRRPGTPASIYNNLIQGTVQTACDTCKQLIHSYKNVTWHFGKKILPIIRL